MLQKKINEVEHEIDNLSEKLKMRDGKFEEIVRGLRDIFDNKEKDEFEDILDSLKEKEQDHDRLFR